MFDQKLAFCKAVCCYYDKFLKLELANKRILLIVMPHQVRNSFSVLLHSNTRCFRGRCETPITENYAITCL